MGSEMPDYVDGIDGYVDNPIQRRRLLVRDLNICLTCTLCDGYLIDATVITICLHTFCRSCIVRYLESSRYCPTCDIQVHKSKPLTALRTDKNLQLLLYKLIPSVYQNEVKRRSDFYLNARASSSCSEDSILTDSEAHEQSVLSHLNDNNHTEFFSPDDSISLSLEYYNDNDTTIKNETDTLDDNVFNALPLTIINGASLTDDITTKRESDIKDIIDGNFTTFNGGNHIDEIVKDDSEKIENNIDEVDSKRHSTSSTIVITSDNNENIVHKRYLQCPAGVNIKHLTKFIRMKYGLSFQHRVDIIYEDEILPKNFTLMDVAYTFKWNRSNPMRFMYRIFESTKTPIFKSIYRQQDVNLNINQNNNSRPKTPDPSTTSAITKTTDNNSNPTENSSPIIENKSTSKNNSNNNNNDTEKSTITEDTSSSSTSSISTIIDSKDDTTKDVLIDDVDDTRIKEDVVTKTHNETAAAVAKRLRDKEIQEFAKKRDLEWANLIRQSNHNDIIPSRETTIDNNKVIEEEKTIDNKKLIKNNKKITQQNNNTTVNPATCVVSATKKRKKSKHSKHLANYSKRRKLHHHYAEIQPTNETTTAEQQNNNKNTDILKLKVKLTPTIHKISPTITTGTLLKSTNKQFKSQITNENQITVVNSKNDLATTMKELTPKELQVKATKLQTTHLEKQTEPKITKELSKQQVELSTKERLLQMRQVRHKTTKNTEIQQKKVRFNNDDDDDDDTKNTEPIKTNKCVPNLVAPKSFTVTMNTTTSNDSNSTTNKKRKIQRDTNNSGVSGDNEPDPKVPSLEIMLINPNPTVLSTQTTQKTINKNEKFNSAKSQLSNQQLSSLKQQKINKTTTVQGGGNNNNNNTVGGRSLSLMQSKMLMMKNLNLTQINKNNGVGGGSGGGGSIQTSGVNSGMEVTKMTPPNNNCNKNNKQIPLSKIKKLSQQQNNKTTSISTLINKTQQQNGGAIINNNNNNNKSKVDNFGALDLSRKSPETTTNTTTYENNIKQNNTIKIEDVKKIVQNKQHLSNLHILSESAVHIRDLMVSAQNKNMSSTVVTTTTTTTTTHQTTPTSSLSLSTATKINIQQKSSTKDFTILSTPVNNTTMKTSIVLPQKQIKTNTTSCQQMSNQLNKKTNESVVASVVPRLSTTHPLLQQTLRIPALQQHKILQNEMRNLQKMPKLQEITKLTNSGGSGVSVTASSSSHHHHPFTNQIRSTPNQTVRNIPNPSAALLARHAQSVQALNASTLATIPPNSVTNTSLTASVSKFTTLLNSSSSSSTASSTKPITSTTITPPSLTQTTVTTSSALTVKTSTTPLILNGTVDKTTTIKSVDNKMPVKNLIPTVKITQCDYVRPPQTVATSSTTTAIEVSNSNKST